MSAKRVSEQPWKNYTNNTPRPQSPTPTTGDHTTQAETSAGTSRSSPRHEGHTPNRPVEQNSPPKQNSPREQLAGRVAKGPGYVWNGNTYPTSNDSLPRTK